LCESPCPLEQRIGCNILAQIRFVCREAHSEPRNVPGATEK
jgi:hypothetical protein